MTDVITLAKQLISRSSVTPHDAGCQEIISARLSPLGFQCESMRFGDVDNLWARYGTTEPLLVFAGHTDVVPPGPEEDWSSPPFQPEIRHDYLYGRGAVDMKGEVAAMIIAAEEFIKNNPNFPGSIAFLITSDEEGSALHGTRKVIEALQARREKINYCLVGEPSSTTHVGDQIRIGRRGSLHGKLIVHGKQGHVAHPHLAINPIHLSAIALHDLVQMEWDQGNEDFPATTFQITNIHGGTGAANVVPGHLEILFNLRFSTAITIAQIKERTQAILDKYGLKYNIDWTVGAEPFLTVKGKLIQAVQQAITEITGLETKLSTGGGTSDGRFIAPTGAEVVELGLSHATAHHVNECANIHDMDKLVSIYKKILDDLLR